MLSYVRIFGAKKSQSNKETKKRRKLRSMTDII